MDNELNLLPALKVILTEKNISRAAEKLNLSQPATSRVFNRLKKTFNDPLMVRAGNRYQLTPRGKILLQQMGQLLPLLDNLWQSDELDLSQIKQTLVLSGTDMDIVYISKQLNDIQIKAPNLHVAIRTSTPRVLDEVINAEVDLALTAFEDERAGLYRKMITNESYVVVTGKNNSLTADTLNLETYLSYPHGRFSFAEATRGRVDAALEYLGFSRNVRLSLPSFLQIPAFLGDPQLLFSVPSSFANYLATHFEIKILPLPFEARSLPIYLYWHERQNNNKLHRWVRESLFQKN